jgi:monooxygenase
VETTCGFLFSCTGYYRYDQGYLPDFAGMDRFGGMIAHPQAWPSDLGCAGQRVVVIGSGATAVTLAPALAETARHVRA